MPVQIGLDHRLADGSGVEIIELLGLIERRAQARGLFQ
jgi:hypothetical protein